MNSAATQVLRIEALGIQGDGIARVNGSTRFVPLALPGELVSVGGDGTVTVVEASGSARRTPPCPHFSSCGGCMAQHMQPEFYAHWKADIVREALLARGFSEPPLRPLVTCPPQSRRRAVLSAARVGSEIQLGYHQRRSHDLVNVSVCPVLEPAIEQALPALRALVAALEATEARITVLATSNGLDVAVACGAKTLSPARAAALSRIATEARWARVSVDGNPIVTRATPGLDMGGVVVTPPPAAFTQAVAMAEQAMRDLVIEAIGNAMRVADLFSGLGAFSFGLSRRSRVTAIDNDRPALDALIAAWRHTQGLKPIETLPRDLFRDPLSPLELKDFDAVVLDPPRAGAEAQAKALARSDVPAIAYVSCNPSSLARDVRHLVDGGYILEAVTPVDQFIYSAHVEAVAILRKPKRKRPR